MTEPDQKEKPLSIFAAVMAGDCDVVKDLFQQGYDARAVDELENTLVHAAVLSGEMAMLRLCLEYDVDVAAKNILGQTAYDLAEVTAQKEFLPFLRFAEQTLDLRAQSYAELEEYTLGDFRADGHQDIMADYCRQVGCDYFLQWLLLPQNKKYLPLEENDLLTAGRDGNAVWQMMAKDGKLPALFSATLWHQKIDDLQKLWRALPLKTLEEADLSLEKIMNKIVTDEIRKTPLTFKLKPKK